MNPAALKANLRDVKKTGMIIVDSDEFTKRNLEKVGFNSNPLEDNTLENYEVHAIPLTSMTVNALEGQGVTRKEAERSKNMFALGFLTWMYGKRFNFLNKWGRYPPFQWGGALFLRRWGWWI